MSALSSSCTSKVGDDVIKNCVTLPLGFKAGTVGDLVPRCSVLLYSFKVCSEALRKLVLPLLPAEAELPSQGWPAEVCMVSRRQNTSWPSVRVEVHDSVLVYGDG